jgi:hypothetical protein
MSRPRRTPPSRHERIWNITLEELEKDYELSWGYTLDKAIRQRKKKRDYGKF